MVCEIPFQLPRQRDLLSQCLPNKGVLYHTDLETPVDGVEAEWCTLQGKGFSDLAIVTILAATYDSSRKVYNRPWQSFASWCRKRNQNL